MLEGLIPELFDEILSLLDVGGLCSLRLTDRNLEQRSRQAFRAAAFSHVIVDFSKGNLQWLSDIASTDLRLAVRSLEVRDGARRGSGKTYGDKGDWPRLKKWAVNLDSHFVRQFVEALSRFPNCTSVTVTDTMMMSPFYTRVKELSSADVIELVLHAYSVSGAPPIRCFRMRMNHAEDWGPSIVLSTTTVASVQSAFTAHIQELVLDFNTTENLDDRYTVRILSLLTAASSVRTLRLMWHYAEADKTDPRSQLGSRLDAFPDFAPPLEDLTLGEMFLTQDHLLRLLAGCRDTLTSLSLYDVRLESGCWTDVLDFLRAGLYRKLRRIAVHGIQDGADGGANLSIAFCPLWNARAEMRERCGGTFEFGTIGAKGRAPDTHVRGVIFEADGEGPAMYSGLQAIVEYSHRESGGAEAPCEEGIDIWRQQLDLETSSGDRGYERWTGLPIIRPRRL